jgi:branched-chain amino acid transport system permease protein
VRIAAPFTRRPSARAVLTVSLLVAIAAAGPLLEVAGQDYWVIVLTRALLLAVLAVASDLVWGVTGIFALGQAIFFGAGAYAAGLLSTKAHITSLILLAPATAAVGLLGGVLIGAFLFFGRRRVGELYVALVTLALTYALEQVANVWNAIGAGNGITGLPLPTLLGQQVQIGLPFFWIALLAMLATLALAWLLVRSQFGLVMRAVRDDPERAEFLGYRRSSVQLIVFAVAAALAAAGGGLYALEEGFVSPSFLGVALSTQVLIYILLGGRGTLIGPVVGVLVLEVGGQRVQQSLPTEWPIIVGSMLLLVILFLPRGLLDARVRVAEAVAHFQHRPTTSNDPPPTLTTGAPRADSHSN